NLAEEGWTDWLDLEQRRLEGMALNTIIRLAEEELVRGDHDRAMVLARRAIAIDDLREDAYRLCMRAAAVGGRKAEAPQQYNLIRALFKRELHPEPDDATRRLAAQIAARPETVAGAPNAPLAPPIVELVRTQADWAGSSPRAVLALDDAAAKDGPLRAAGDQLVERFNARTVERTCNQLLLEFSDSRAAVRAAHAAQAHQLRMSAHASTSGDAAKAIASRLLPLAAPGHLLVSDEVRDALTDELDAKVEDLGE